MVGFYESSLDEDPSKRPIHSIINGWLSTIILGVEKANNWIFFLFVDSSTHNV